MRYHLVTVVVAVLIAAVFAACVWWNVLSIRMHGREASVTLIPATFAAFYYTVFVFWVTTRIIR